MADIQTLEPSPMAAEPQTPASPEPSTDSTKKRRKKKKSKKNKSVDGLGHEEEEGAAAVTPEPKDVTVEASIKNEEEEAQDCPSDSTTHSAKKKRKKKSKKHKAVDGLGHEEQGAADAAAPEPMEVTVEGSIKKEEEEAQDSPSDSTHSSKKKRKKKKKKSKEREAVDDVAHEEEGAPEPMEVTVEASIKKEEEAQDSPSDSIKKKKRKKSKKRKAVDGEPGQEEEGGEDGVVAAPEPTDGTIEASRHSKKHKAAVDDPAQQEEEVKSVAALEPVVKAASTEKVQHSKKYNKVGDTIINVTVDASLAAGGSAAGGAPVVGYFPTGYNPLAATPNSARLFRNTKHPSRLDLVVQSPGGGPDFVGRSYAGEAALPQLCNYALGVLDKASGILKIVPIASDKILRLEPYLEVQNPSHSQQSGVTSEAASAVGAGEMRVQDLTNMYGAKKDKDQDMKWKSLNEQTNDPSAFVDLDFGNSETNANTSENEPVIVRNIPPYDPTADTSEKAYLFDEIIPKNIRSHLLEILGHMESGEFSSKGYGSFVSNRVEKLEKLQGGDKERLAWILSYITHLLTLMERSGSMSKGHKRDKETSKAPVVPQAVYRHMAVMFTDDGSSALSTEKKELLINYILVLTLFADDFRTDPVDILADLKMTRPMLKPYYEQLGCKSVSTGAFKAPVMTLPAPLNFPKDVAKRRRRRG